MRCQRGSQPPPWPRLRCSRRICACQMHRTRDLVPTPPASGQHHQHQQSACLLCSWSLRCASPPSLTATTPAVRGPPPGLPPPVRREGQPAAAPGRRPRLTHDGGQRAAAVCPARPCLLNEANSSSRVRARSIVLSQNSRTLPALPHPARRCANPASAACRV